MEITSTLIKKLIKEEIKKLNHRDLEFVKSGLELIDTMIFSRNDLEKFIPFDEVEEPEDFYDVLENVREYFWDHRYYISLWVMGKLAEFGESWVQNMKALDVTGRRVKEVPSNWPEDIEIKI